MVFTAPSGGTHAARCWSFRGQSRRTTVHPRQGSRPPPVFGPHHWPRRSRSCPSFGRRPRASDGRASPAPSGQTAASRRGAGQLGEPPPVSAGSGIRTRTSLRTDGFEPSAVACYAIPAGRNARSLILRYLGPRHQRPRCGQAKASGQLGVRTTTRPVDRRLRSPPLTCAPLRFRQVYRSIGRNPAGQSQRPRALPPRARSTQQRQEPRVRSRSLRLAAPLVVGAVALTACGSNKSESSGSSGGSTSGGSKTATIGLSAPLSGSLSSLGLGMKNSADLAVKQANAKQTVQGWTLKFDAEDDQGQANVGQQVASKLSSQKEVVGVVGPLNSDVGQQEQPVLAQANITQISPANTNPSLTQGPDYSTGTKKRLFANYFRTATTDSVQGPFAAQYVVQTLGKKKVALVNDKKTYGAGLVGEFKKELTKEGGSVVADEAINPGDKDFSAVISKIKTAGPELLYYGGEYPEASLLSSQMKQANLNIPLMGGDGIYDPTYISVAKEAAEGDLATSVGAPAESLDTAKQFVADYKAGKYSEPFAAYGAYTYDATNVIISALTQVLPGKNAIDDSVRQAVVKAVQGTSIDGATGKVSFDQYGDTSNKTLTVYKVTSGAWKAEKTGSFQG